MALNLFPDKCVLSVGDDCNPLRAVQYRVLLVAIVKILGFTTRGLGR
jgi:hypothetical protein